MFQLKCNMPYFLYLKLNLKTLNMVAGIIVNRTQQEIPSAATMAKTESDAIKIVLGAARKLI